MTPLTHLNPTERRRVALIGPARSGKDFLLATNGYTPVSMSEPMVHLAHAARYGHGAEGHYASPAAGWDKSTPGFRQLLQQWGQWGRGYVDEYYPLTPERMQWLAEMRRPEYLRWFAHWRLQPEQLGRPEFWITGAAQRCLEYAVPAGISNLRFWDDIEGARRVEIPVGIVFASEETRRTRSKQLDDAPAHLGRCEPSEHLAEEVCARIAEGAPERLPTWVSFVVINDPEWLAENWKLVCAARSRNTTPKLHWYVGTEAQAALTVDLARTA